MASTSVVLPWSTWAMIATLRISGRVFTRSIIARVRCGNALRPETALARCKGAERLAQEASSKSGQRTGVDHSSVYAI